MLKKEFDYAIERGIINYDDVLKQIEMMKKQELLNKHPHDIWQGKNGSWYTYLPQGNSRKLIKKNSKEKIEEAIIKCYQSEENRQITFHVLYYKWLLEYKTLQVDMGTIDRINCDYEKFYRGTGIDKTLIQDIDLLMVDIFIHKAIKDHDFNKKQYYNMSIVLRQVLEYAIKEGYIESSPLNRFKLGRNVLRKDKKKKNYTQVYFVNEKKKMESILMKDFLKDNKNTILLAILFVFQTGLRLGELVALKWSDISGDIITVQRTETRYRIISPDGSKGRYVIDIKENTKGAEGEREVYLTPKAQELLKLIKKTNFKNGYESEFIFVYEKGRMHERCVDNCIRKYCGKLHINERSMHKIRKTYISSLIDAGINIDAIREQVGHKDAQTTLNCYCYNRYDDTQTHDMIAKAVY